ncbi:MAG: phosphoglycerate mutase [Rhodanobacteraceae bacterium]
MSILHLMLPPLARFEASSPLRRWLVRGDRLADAQRGRLVALRQVFQMPGASVPVAALLREAIAHDGGENTWLCADPAHVLAETAGARLLACGDLDLASEEAEQFAASLRPLFGDAGMPLEICSPQRWCLRLPREAGLPGFTAPDDALGTSLLDHLPQGEAGRRWRALFNEAQVILHAHPLNEVRRSRGQMPVNALWFWGAGALPMWVRSPLTLLASEDPIAHALAQRAKVGLSSPTFDAFDALARAGSDALFDLERGDPAIIEHGWLSRLERVLRRGRTSRIDAAFVSGERFRIKRWHHWRYWRRDASLPPLAGEGAEGGLG